MRINAKLHLLGLLTLLASCADKAPAPTNLLIDPPTGPTMMETPVKIRGEGLSALVMLDYQNPGNTAVDFRVRARLGIHELIGAYISGKNEITAIVPAGLDLGAYDLAVIDAHGNAAHTPNAFTVRPAMCSDVPGPGADCGLCNQIEGCRCVRGMCVMERDTPLPTTGTVPGEGNSPDPTGHRSVCGDRIVEGLETCDDGNLIGEDGCAAGCLAESGWVCTGMPSVCATVCGDGFVRGIEICDDAGTMPGDGCDVACNIELGWACRGDPSVCTANCGDSMVAGSEDCDDGPALISGDGCSSACALERGWICPLPGMPCATVCGDAIRAGAEPCDDGNTSTNDGCNASCVVESGWDCGPTGELCTPICGDSVLLGNENCDDGNASPNDGCSAMCRVETGWDCGPTGRSCRSVCGDGWIRSAEVCDDGNLISGDGCSGTCTPEQGFTCTGEGVPCTPICGDSSLRGGETCDDGNILPGDGCSATCARENGYACPIPGAPCQTVCGDGYVRGIEICDDGNTASGDGCTAACSRVESGYLCLVPGVPCTGICGDAIILAQEGCDDGNTIAFDGCGSNCEVELGWDCPIAGVACGPLCGDGLIRANEVCDDNNLLNGDGCTAACTTEQGFTCTTPGQLCNAICGDALLRGIETCDDGNANATDGCSATCLTETGWSCPVAGAACLPVCGDGLLVAAEVCDDDNTASGDGCSTTCALELGFTCGAPGQACLAICGDSLVRGIETCDDGGTNAGDGCGATCSTELGWACPTPGQACGPLCGDRRLVANEPCDDGNPVSGDGCSITCTIEPGFTCPTGLICNSICGDGLVRGRERCDDGNTVATDGCNAECRVDIAYECNTAQPSVCTPKCGNGRRDENEACDDGNRANGDGCNISCLVENNYVCVRFPSTCTPGTNVALVEDSAVCPGSGTTSSPYCSINAALATALNTIYVRPGEYRENIAITTNRTLSIVAEDGAMLIASSASTPAFRVSGGANITVTGLAISAGSSRVSAESAEIRLVASQVGPGASGVGVVSSGTGEVTLEQTRVVGNPGGGVDIGGTGGFLIAASVIVQNGVTTAGQTFGGVRIGSTNASSRITNTTIADNRAASGANAGVLCDAANVTVLNTIVWGNLAGTTASGVSANCRPTYSNLNPSAVGTGNQSIDPIFVLPSYHLSGTSPLIGDGDPATTARLDYDGRAIPSNGRAEIGAYEVTGNYPFPSGRPAEPQALDERNPTGRYLGLYPHGLFPDGAFKVPPAHKTAGNAAGTAVIARNAAGAPAANGRWVFLTLGGSDLNEAVCTDSANNPPPIAGGNANCRAGSWQGDLLLPLREAIDRTNLLIVNGAYPNQFAENFTQDGDPFPSIPTNANYPTVNGNWDRIRDRVLPVYQPGNVPTEAQVQTMFILLANANPVVSLPDRHADAVQLQMRLGTIVRRAKQRYPNLQQIFLSSRPYSGFSTNRAPGEPYAYETAFAVKWLIEAQIAQMAAGGTVIDTRAGDLNYSNGTAPWLGWGPYMWHHFAPSQAVGIRWTAGDFENTSPNGFFTTVGEAKMQVLIKNYFTLHMFSRCWLMQFGTCN